MALINNKKIEIYDLDSINTILTRVIANMNTIPNLIYFPNGKPINMEELSKNIEIIDLKPIIEDAISLKDIYKYIKNIDNMFIKMDTYKLIEYYIILNKNIKKIFNIDDQVFVSALIEEKIVKIIKELENLDIKSDITKEQIENIFTTTNFILKNLEKTIEKTKEKAENILLEFEKFKKIDGVEYTKFEEEILKFEIQFKIKNISSLLEIFNLIKLNENVPFAVTHNFYKVYNEFEPPIIWKNLFNKTKSFNKQYKNIDSSKNIIFKILVESKKKIDIYTEAVLSFNNDVISVNLEYNIKNIGQDMLENNKYRNNFINKFLSVFEMKYDPDDVNIITKEVRGRFYIPSQSMNKYIFMDLILNDSLFSSLMNIKEKKISKKESIYIYFENQNIGDIRATITPQLSTNDFFNIEYNNLFPINTEYINVKISYAENIEKIKKFQNIFSKLFSLYNEKKEDIVEYYSRFNIVLESQTVEDEPDEEFDEDESKLFKVDPYVFKKGYNTYCQRGHKPTYISDEKALKAIEEGKPVLLFPKEKVDKSIPKYYVCNHEKYPYPGLKKNHLDNKDLFPYIPCCYPVPQTNKSKYKEYYFGEKIIEYENTGQNVFLTRKILKDNEYGILPDNITKMFNIINKKGKFFRRGVERSYSSFLSCILNALDIDYKNINDVRKKLARPDLAASCKQELYDIDIEEIVNKIKDINIYLDPKLFVHLLETEYKCNIFIFTDKNEGELVIPRHIKGYYKTKNNYKTILIYEHMGSKEDKALYPQCEYIFLHPDETSELVENTFNYNSIVSEKIFEIFNKLNYSYIFNKKIQLINLNLKSDITFISQYIDSYGKTRIINIKYKNEYISIITTPIQPLKLINENKIYKTNLETALNLIKYLKIQNIKQVLNQNNFIKEFKGILGNIDIKIILDEKTLKIEKIEIEDIAEFNILTNNSVIDLFNKNKKISRYIVEYFCWLFSKFMKNENLDYKNITPDIYKKFKEKYIIIDKNFVYENIPKMFSLNDSGIMFNKKIVIKSEDTLKRLFYVLRLLLVRNLKKIINMYENKNIENYYIDITDFNYYPNQIILEGENSIIKLINEKNNINVIHNKILLNFETNNKSNIKDQIKDEEDDNEEDENIENNIEENSEKKFKKIWNIKPYFFKNKLINNKMYIAQNIDSYMKALTIAITWKESNINLGPNVKEYNTLEEFTLYSYINQNNIKSYNIIGQKNNYNIEIIGYKINFENEKRTLYTVLLPINLI